MTTDHASNTLMDAPRARLMEITPEVAQRWLTEANIRNRNLNERTVRLIACDITEGRWKDTGDTIKFATDNTLLDGQHRLAAIVRSGVTLKLFVVFGLSVGAQDVMDTHRPRTVADALHIGDVVDAKRLAAVARLALLRSRGLSFTGGRAVTHSEVLAFARDTPLLAESITMIGSTARNVPMTPSVADYCFWRFYRIDPDEAYNFFDAFASGANLAPGSPVLALRRRLADIEPGRRRRIDKQEQIAACMRAWNAWRSGRHISKIPVRNGSGHIEIPEPV